MFACLSSGLYFSNNTAYEDISVLQPTLKSLTMFINTEAWLLDKNLTESNYDVGVSGLLILPTEDSLSSELK